ncbi:zinc finger CCCH domain-containing protein 37 isoform X1 [Carex littledalei]|uniref:Zinc finger CCCH domain-containing protein 37 isoform X1 n=1 Tax=Carex littledalei TaxID=544730 RepID=A0A833RHN8_9POAL|nr:zinc finger CCCH domain-containing protein 37 isoform X1 [Carex littledalei]
MSNPTYGYGSSYNSGYSGLSSLHPDLFSAPSDRYSAASDHFNGDPGYYRSRYSHHSSAAPPPPIDVGLPPSRRSLEASYHHPYPGQIEAPIYTHDYMVKRPRVESKLPIYPQRPGEKDCAHYMMTRTCKYGETCKFDHPIWVPQGGLPDWKETPHVPVPAEESLPERPGEPDCPFYMKTSTCKFAVKCKFNHPKGVISKNSGEADKLDKLALPERPSEPLCSFFAKTGMCKFGANCKFNHPKDLHKTSDGEHEISTALACINADPTAAIAKPSSGYNSAVLYNSKGLPMRAVYLSSLLLLNILNCKYGSTCRFNHPDRSVINPPLAAPIVDQAVPPPVYMNLPLVAANILQNFDLHSIAGLPPTAYPQRLGEMECDFYMKTGQCKFGDKCKFHHPLDRSAVGSDGKKQTVKLTLAGLPRREGAAVCAFYMKTATCKFGATCKFDHPPPGELVAMASKHGTSSTEPGTTEPGPEEVNPKKEEEEGEEEDEGGEEKNE